ncbi:MAG: hypothetical protein HY208_05505 [Nitrospirae bacterium]|nr:hypothetical protein [Nitrospirota bacterium]
MEDDVKSRPHGGTGGLFRRNESGFSLIETILALALLTGGCLAVVGMFVVGDRASAGAARTDEALALARSVMEWKRMLPYERLDEDDLDGDGRSDGRSLAGADAPGLFHREWRLWRDLPGPGLSIVSVGISWSDERGRVRHLDEMIVRADLRAGGL